MVVLGGLWQPITRELNFVEGRPEDRVRDYLDWRSAHLRRTRGVEPQVREVEGSLEELLRQLLPFELRMGRKWIFAPVDSSGPYGTFLLSSAALGTDAQSLRFAFYSRSKARTITIADDEGNPRAQGQRPARSLSVDPGLPGADGKDTRARVVGTVRAGAGALDWVDLGEPLPFEEVGRYAKRRKADRLPKDLLYAYAAELGLRPNDESFYAPQGRALLVEEGGAASSDERVLSLEEARADWGPASSQPGAPHPRAKESLPPKHNYVIITEDNRALTAEGKEIPDGELTPQVLDTLRRRRSQA